MSFGHLFSIEWVRRPLVIHRFSVLLVHAILSNRTSRLLLLYNVDASIKLISRLSSLLTRLLWNYSLICTRIIIHHKWVLFVWHSSHSIVFDKILWTTHKSILSIVAWPLVIRHVLAHHFLLLVYFLAAHLVFTDLLIGSRGSSLVRSSSITNRLNSLTLTFTLVMRLPIVVSLLDLYDLCLIRFAATWSCKVVDLLVLGRILGVMII